MTKKYYNYNMSKQIVPKLLQPSLTLGVKTGQNMGVDSKNDVLGRILHLFVMLLHKYS